MAESEKQSIADFAMGLIEEGRVTKDSAATAIAPTGAQVVNLTENPITDLDISDQVIEDDVRDQIIEQSFGIKPSKVVKEVVEEEEALTVLPVQEQVEIIKFELAETMKTFGKLMGQLLEMTGAGAMTGTQSIGVNMAGPGKKKKKKRGHTSGY